MNRLHAGIMSLVGVFAAMLVCGCSPDRFVVQGESGASVFSIDAHGVVQIAGPITTEVALESEDLAEHAGRGEFLVRNGNGHTVARVDGRTGNLYLHGQLVHDAQLEASALPEFVITNAAGTAMALIDAYGNLKYRGRIGMVMTRTVSSTEYAPCGTLEVTVTLYYYDTPLVKALGLREEFPEGWTYVESPPESEVSVEPSAGEGPVMDFAWVNPPEFPLTFTYSVRAPQGAEGQAVIGGQARYRTEGPEYRSNSVTTYLTEDQTPDGEVSCEGEGEQMGMQVPAEGTEEGGGLLDFLGDGEGEGTSEGGLEGEGEGEGQVDVCDQVFPDCGIHSADSDDNWSINLTELLRVIQFFNIKGYHCVTAPATTEDGYVPGSGENHSCDPHDSDYVVQDWKIDLTELLRLVQFFNFQEYQRNTKGEDGFLPGKGGRGQLLDREFERESGW